MQDKGEIFYLIGLVMVDYWYLELPVFPSRNPSLPITFD